MNDQPSCIQAGPQVLEDTFGTEAAAPPISERDKLLEEAAVGFATIARSVGAPLDEANHELAAAYTRVTG